METEERVPGYSGLLHLLKTSMNAQEFKRHVNDLCCNTVRHLANQTTDDDDLYKSKLDITKDEATELHHSLKGFLSAVIYEGHQGLDAINSLFPDNFHKDLRNLLSKCALNNQPTWRSLMIANQVSYPKLVEFKWKLSRNDDDLPPTCILHLTKDDQSEVMVEMSKNTVDTVLGSLAMIRDQLTSL